MRMLERDKCRRSVIGLGFVWLVAVPGCAPSEVADDPGTSPGLQVFPATPADGPMPEIGPAPDDYRPTAAGAPSTDIWLGRLVRDGDGLLVEGLANATDREGYDNQPSFSHDGQAIYYVSAVDETQTEVKRLGMTAGGAQPVTRTPDASEFSPTPIPGQSAISAIHEIRGKQYLWRYDTSGESLGPIFSTAEPVGYHAWADEHVVVMFILGSPATLQVGDALSGEIRVVAESPGRSIHRIPGTTDISFVRKIASGDWWIERLDPFTGDTDRLTQTLPDREDYAWTPEGEIIMGDGSTLHRWSAGSGWTEFQNLADLGIEGITRLAVNADGDRIAIVADRTGG